MFNFHKRESLFQTKVVVQKKEELPVELKQEPIPETKKQQKELNKHKYLPSERLQMQLNKQAKRDKKKAAKKPILKTSDIDRISKSMNRVINLVL